MNQIERRAFISAAGGAAVLRYLETPDGARLLAPETNAAPGAKVKKMFGKVFGGKSATKEGGKHAALGSESAAGDALATRLSGHSVRTADCRTLRCTMLPCAWPGGR